MGRDINNLLQAFFKFTCLQIIFIYLNWTIGQWTCSIFGQHCAWQPGISSKSSLYLLKLDCIFSQIIFIFLCWTCSIVVGQCAWQPADKLASLLLFLHSLVLPGKSPTRFKQISHKIWKKSQTWYAFFVLFLLPGKSPTWFIQISHKIWKKSQTWTCFFPGLLFPGKSSAWFKQISNLTKTKSQPKLKKKSNLTLAYL